MKHKDLPTHEQIKSMLKGQLEKYVGLSHAELSLRQKENVIDTYEVKTPLGEYQIQVDCWKSLGDAINVIASADGPGVSHFFRMVNSVSFWFTKYPDGTVCWAGE